MHHGTDLMHCETDLMQCMNDHFAGNPMLIGWMMASELLQALSWIWNETKKLWAAVHLCIQIHISVTSTMNIYYQIGALCLIDEQYIVWYMIHQSMYTPHTLTCCWLGVYNFLVGIHFAGCDCGCWIRFVLWHATDCTWKLPSELYYIWF